jgi:hypothetical protein
MKLAGVQSQSGYSGEEKILAAAGNRTPDRPARSLVTILTELSGSLSFLRFLYYVSRFFENLHKLRKFTDTKYMTKRDRQRSRLRTVILKYL